MGTTHTFKYLLAKLSRKQAMVCADNTTHEERMESLAEIAVDSDGGHYAVLERIDGDLFRVIDEVVITPSVEIRDIKKGTTNG